MILLLIPHFNNLIGLQNTISSIYHDKPLRILVVDDGSKENQQPNLEELKCYLNPRVELEIIYLENNVGIAKALNIGLDYFLERDDFEYLARIDCGDVVVKNRFQIQANFLKRNPDVGMVGSWVDFESENHKPLYRVKPPTKHNKIKKKMSRRCSFIHPSVMIRREVIEDIGSYPLNYEAAEDYAYFYKIVKSYKTANINKSLTKVISDPNGISVRKREVQNLNKIRVIRRYSPNNMARIYGVSSTFALSLVPQSIVHSVKKKVLK